MIAPSLFGKTTLRRSRRRLGAGMIVGLVIVAVYAFVAIAAPWVAPADPLAQNIPAALQPPGLDYLLGTDQLGRDVASRLIHAASVDMLVGFSAAAAALLLGGTLGLVTGYARGWLDVVITRLMDIFQVVPGIVVVIVLLLVFGSGIPGLIFALVIASWVAYARLVRAEVLVVRDSDYALAARLAGLGHVRVLFRHVLPNVWLQAIVYLTSDIVLAISALTALGYLGIGVQAPAPEWGVMIASGQAYLQTAPWLTVIPGVTIAVLGLGLALISDGVTRLARRGS